MIVCSGCNNSLNVGGGQNTAEIASTIRKEGWRLVIGLGWTCENCIRCIYTPDVSVSGTIETIH